MRNRLRLILLGAFCAGVLLTGIGAGIAIVEYTSLEYTGLHMLGGQETDAEYEFKVELQEEEQLRIMNCQGVVRVVYDISVPVNTVRCSMRYDADMLRMTPEIVKNGDSGYQYQWLYFDRKYVGSEFDLFMQNKDMILADLKKGKIGTYMIEEPIKEITVTLNPLMRDVVSVEGR